MYSGYKICIATFYFQLRFLKYFYLNILQFIFQSNPCSSCCATMRCDIRTTGSDFSLKSLFICIDGFLLLITAHEHDCVLPHCHILNFKQLRFSLLLHWQFYLNFNAMRRKSFIIGIVWQSDTAHVAYT